MLDAAMQKIELCCIELRRICEINRPASNPVLFAQSSYYAKEIYGEVTLMDTGWLDIRLNALLPHCRFSGGTQYISDTITRLLKRFRDTGGELPFFQKAFLAIVEHRPVAGCGAFDQDNKGFKAVINSLKGRVFADDDQFELSLGLFTIQDEESCCQMVWELIDIKPCGNTEKRDSYMRERFKGAEFSSIVTIDGQGQIKKDGKEELFLRL